MKKEWIMEKIMPAIALIAFMFMALSVMATAGKDWIYFLRPFARLGTGTFRSIGRAIWRGANASWRGAIATGQPWPARILLLIPAATFGILGICFSIVEAFLPRQGRRN